MQIFKLKIFSHISFLFFGTVKVIKALTQSAADKEEEYCAFIFKALSYFCGYFGESNVEVL